MELPEHEESHCLVCGNTHSGKCNPGDFVYYRCRECERHQVIPWDVLAFSAWDGMQCGCGAEAKKVWERITYEEYMAAEEDTNGH